MRTHSKETQSQLNPDLALEILKEGNDRFVKNLKANRNLLQQVNEDIKEGLQNILIGSEKFSNTTVKAQVFFERLKESRAAFLNYFLQPEIETIFRNLGRIIISYL